MLLAIRDRREIPSGVNPLQLAILIVTTLKGRLMSERLQRTPEQFNIACHHLE